MSPFVSVDAPSYAICRPRAEVEVAAGAAAMAGITGDIALSRRSGFGRGFSFNVFCGVLAETAL